MERELAWEEKLALAIFGEGYQLPVVSEAGKAYIHGARNFLTARQKELFTLRFEEGLPLEECAKKMGISLSYAKHAEVVLLIKFRHPGFAKELKQYIEWILVEDERVKRGES